MERPQKRSLHRLTNLPVTNPPPSLPPSLHLFPPPPTRPTINPPPRLVKNLDHPPCPDFALPPSPRPKTLRGVLAPSRSRGADPRERPSCSRWGGAPPGVASSDGEVEGCGFGPPAVGGIGEVFVGCFRGEFVRSFVSSFVRESPRGSLPRFLACSFPILFSSSRSNRR